MYRSNSIRLSGTLACEPVLDHRIYSESFLKLFISVKRLSGTEDILPVTASERLIPEGVLPVPGMRAALFGQIRSYNRFDGSGSHLIITAFARELSFENGAGEYGLDSAPPEGPEAPSDVNEAELTGNICKPVVYRRTPFMREIADILIAVNRRYGKSDYLPVIAWGRNARFADGLSLGEEVRIRGRLQSRKYIKMLEGGLEEERTAYEISCSSIERTA